MSDVDPDLRAAEPDRFRDDSEPGSGPPEEAPTTNSSPETSRGADEDAPDDATGGDEVDASSPGTAAAGDTGALDAAPEPSEPA